MMDPSRTFVARRARQSAEVSRAAAQAAGWIRP